VPSITGRVEINLTVRDPLVSAAWYAELLGMQTRYDHTSDDGQMRYICLVEPSSSLVICLVGHAKSSGEPFTEFRTGLDHLEFLVASRDDLEQWAERLDELGVPHSGVKNPGYTANAMLTFRDPDNIQLEFFGERPCLKASERSGRDRSQIPSGGLSTVVVRPHLRVVDCAASEGPGCPLPPAPRPVTRSPGHMPWSAPTSSLRSA
jgi:glyoxylase I family protein